MQKSIPFSLPQSEELAKIHPTPFYIYDEEGIHESARKLNEAFSWNKGFKEYFAVKATPNPSILEILKGEGCGADCSSLAELKLSEQVGLTGEGIMFTSNNTPEDDFKEAVRLGAIINLDDISHIDFLQEATGLPELLSFRFNPGIERAGNAIIGNPEDAKFGLTRTQLFEAYAIAKGKGVTRFGLHAMVASNELDESYFIETARMLFQIMEELKEKLGITLEFINLGGGIGIPYKPDEREVDVAKIGSGVRVLYEEMNLAPLKLYMECGRYITGPYGYLVSRVRHLKDTHKQFVGLDASMSDLMRPGMYGAYHHISLLGGEGESQDHVYDVTGSLCENNDKFAIDRALPKLIAGDTVVIHDAGAHGHSMGFNYNGKLRPAEFLLHKDGTFTMIRRAETLEDHFATLSF